MRKLLIAILKIIIVLSAIGMVSINMTWSGILAFIICGLIISGSYKLLTIVEQGGN